LTPPCFRLVVERLWVELRRPAEDLRAPPDEARLDGVRLLLDALREPDFALVPLELERLRVGAERRPPLDEPLFLALPLRCPDFEVSWAILASLFASRRLGLLRFSPPESSAIAYPNAVGKNALQKLGLAQLRVFHEAL
jgi:hypothetical protein